MSTLEFEIQVRNYHDIVKSLKILKTFKPVMNMYFIHSDVKRSIVLESLDENEFSYYFRSEIEVLEEHVHKICKNKSEFFLGCMDINVLSVVLSQCTSPILTLQKFQETPNELVILDSSSDETGNTIKIDIKLSEKKKLKEIQKLQYDFSTRIKLSEIIQIGNIGINKNVCAQTIRIDVLERKKKDNLISEDEHTNRQITRMSISGSNTCKIEKLFGINFFDKTSKWNPLLSQSYELFKFHKFLKCLEGSTSFIELKQSYKNNPLLILCRNAHSKSFVSLLLPVIEQ